MFSRLVVGFIVLILLAETETTLFASPGDPPRPEVDKVIRVVEEEAKKDKNVLPKAYLEEEKDGKKAIRFVILPTIKSEVDKEGGKRTVMDFLTPRFLEYVAIKNGANESDKITMDKLTSDFKEAMGKQMELARIRRGEIITQLAMGDKLVEGSLSAYAEGAAKRRNALLLTSPLTEGIHYKVTLETKPADGKIFFLPKMDYIIYKNVELKEDTPEVWRQFWRQPSGSETYLAGKYYFRVEWDKNTLHRSAEIGIEKDDTVLPAFTPDK